MLKFCVIVCVLVCLYLGCRFINFIMEEIEDWRKR